MIQFKPFKGMRPAKSKAFRVTTQNMDFYDLEPSLLDDEDPESFRNILKPILGKEKFGKEEYGEVRALLDEFLSEGILLKDKKVYYVYEQEDQEGETCLGIIGLVSVDDFEQKLIKKHENTIVKLESKFSDFLEATHLQADPVLLTYPENQSIEVITSMTTRKSPTLEFSGKDGYIHRLWQVSDRLVMSQLKTAIEKLPSLYIADGHHRMASSYKFAQKKRENDPDFFGGEAYNYTMAMLVPSNYLQVKDYNRVVKGLNGLTPEAFLEKISDVFTVIEKDEAYFPTYKHHISLYLDGKFYALYVNQEYRGEPKGLGELDTYLCEEHIFKPVLDIQDSTKDDRVTFVKGTGDEEGILKLKKMVDEGEYDIAFGFSPVLFKDLALIADEGQIMPPKSTLILPKMLSALTILDLED